MLETSGVIDPRIRAPKSARPLLGIAERHA